MSHIGSKAWWKARISAMWHTMFWTSAPDLYFPFEKFHKTIKFLKRFTCFQRFFWHIGRISPLPLGNWFLLLFSDAWTQCIVIKLSRLSLKNFSLLKIWNSSSPLRGVRSWRRKILFLNKIQIFFLLFHTNCWEFSGVLKHDQDSSINKTNILANRTNLINFKCLVLENCRFY